MNYIVRSCTSQEESIVSAGTLTIGTVISFTTDEEGTFCGTILSMTENPHDSLYIEPFDSCCECVLNEMTDITSLNFIICGTETTLNIDPTYFCEQSNLFPSIGEVFQFLDSEGNLICATLTGYSSDSSQSNPEPVDGPFENCWQCEPKDFPPRSANTETTVCVICCDCGASASTINQVVAPHPVWTDGYGASVTQLNMITLGGNGLNS